MPDLPDVNVWLALATDAHVHHKRARRYWEAEAGDALVFCRVTQLSLLRHLTNPKVMGEGSLRPAGAWSKYREFAALPEIEFYGEPSEIDEWLERFSTGSRTSPNLWTDAYLAAFAKAANLRFVSFDKACATFAVETLILAQ